LIINGLNLLTFIRQFASLGLIKVIKRFKNWMDLGIFLSLCYIAQSISKEMDVIWLRCVESALTLVIWFRSIYFLRLIEQLSPFVDMIVIIINDIKFFMVIFLIMILAFVESFMLIGRNLSELGIESDFANIYDSMEHVYKASLGEFNTDSYQDNEMSTILFTLFLGLSFFMQILLLNMLIAIMSDTFNRINEIRESKKKQSQLLFITDNWWINPIKEKEKIVYIIAAC